MTAVTPSALVLPRAAALTDALLAPVQRISPALDCERLTDRLDEALAHVRTQGREKTLRVDGYLLRSTRGGCVLPPRSEPFEWSVRGARRTLGLAAVRHCLRTKSTPAVAVRNVMDTMCSLRRPSGESAGSFRSWLASLSPGARGAVLADACTWATSLHGALQWGRLGPGYQVGGPDRWWNCRSAPAIAIRARAEVSAPIPAGVGGRAGDGSPGTALLIVLGGWPGRFCRSELALAAVAHSVTSGPSPARVLAWWPQSGRALGLTVDERLLDDGVATIVRLAEAAGPVALCGDASKRRPDERSCSVQ